MPDQLQAPGAHSHEGAERLDPRALDRVLRRMARVGVAPWLHAEVARRMGERLALIRKRPDEVVDWWGHTGGGASVLADAYPKARRIVVEPSQALAQRSRSAAARPWWVPGRARVTVVDEAAVPEARAGLVWSNMMLHASVDPAATMRCWHRALASQGFLMFSTFGPDTLSELREIYADASWGAPGRGFIDMHDLGDMLVHSGFADPVMDMERIRLSWDGAEAALRELRGLGGNVATGRTSGLRTPRWRERLVQALDERRVAGRLGLGFEIVYGHAFMPAPGVRAGSQTAVPLERMRAMLKASGGPRT